MDLWSHQKEAINRALKHEGYMFAFDMGTGKSRAAIEFANRIEADTVLIVCPKSVVSVWSPEFEKYSSREFDVISLDKGSVRQKAKHIETAIALAPIKKKPTAIVINYESIWRSPVGPDYDKRNRMVSLGPVLSHTWDLVIMDESQKIKSQKSKVSWFCKTLGKKATSSTRVSRKR